MVDRAILDQLFTKREELFKNVWEEPLIRLAPKYGLRNTDLSRACKILKIPLPTNRHWTRLRLGQQGEPRPILPELSENPLNGKRADTGRAPTVSTVKSGPSKDLFKNTAASKKQVPDERIDRDEFLRRKKALNEKLKELIEAAPDEKAVRSALGWYRNRLGDLIWLARWEKLRTGDKEPCETYVVGRTLVSKEHREEHKSTHTQGIERYENLQIKVEQLNRKIDDFVRKLQNLQEEYLTPEEAGKLLKVKVATLARWRVKKIGPDYFIICGNIRYKKDEIGKFFEKRRIRCWRGEVR